jgi:hypothetical protein
MNPHEAAVKSALRAGDEINRLIGRLGTADHPRGEVLVAYRNAQRGVRAALDHEPGFQRDMTLRDALGGLRVAVRQTARESLSAAVSSGQEQAERQAAAWGLGQRSEVRGQRSGVDTAAMEAAWLGTVDAQVNTALALAATGADEAEIVGDESRAGVLRPAPVVAEGSRWVAAAVAAALIGWWDWLLEEPGGERGGGRGRAGWSHQAVAAIDERTTDCCLRVNGQIQPMDKPFHLTGTPRFASEQMAPPFHWYCRSAEVLLPAGAEDDKLTTGMRDAARRELAARGPDGKNRVEIHPAHARSRRP